jgi:hypothetical protein
MQRKDFLKLLALAPLAAQTMKLQAFSKITDSLPATKKNACAFYFTW